MVNQELEQQGAERTRELTATNNELRKEIAELKHAEALQHAKEQEFRDIVENAPDQIIRYDREFRRTYVNPAAAKAYGLTVEAMTSKPVGSNIRDTGFDVKEDQLSLFRQRITAVFDTGKSTEYEINWTMPEGRKYYSVRLFPELDLSGSVVNVLGIARDITERKQAEAALHRTEDRIRLIIDTIPTMAWSIRTDGTVDFLNQRWLDYTGLSLEQYIKEPTGPIHPQDIPRVMEKWLVNKAAGKAFDNEIRLRRADGEYRWFLVRTAPLHDEQGNLVKWYGVSIDIEDSKRAQDELRLAYQRLSYHVENTPLAVIEFDKNLFIKRWSKRAEEIFGWKESEALGKNVYDPDFPIIYKEDIQAVDKINEQLTEGIVNWNLSLNRNYTKDGNVIYSEWYNSVLKDEHGNVITILSLVHNVTERKKAEEQKEFEQREKEALINTTNDLIWSVDRDFKIIAVNKAFIRRVKELTGITVKSGDDLLVPEFFPKDILTFWKEAYFRALSGETFKKEIYTPADNKFAESWTEISFNPIYKDGVVVGLACYSRNITERKLAEEQLRQSEAHLIEAQQLAKMGSWDYDIKADRLTWSEELYNVFGTDKQTFIETHGSFLNLIDAEEREFALQTSRHTQQTGEPFTIEYHITTPKGEKRVIQEHGYGQKDDNGKVVRLFGTAQDITERKKAEKTLVENENYLRTIIQTEPQCVKLLGINGELENMNPSGLEMIEADSLQQVKGKSVLNLINNPYRKAFVDLTQNVFKGNSGTLEFEITGLKGTHRWLETHAVPLKNAEGKILSLLGISMDITERKKAEEGIKNTNEQLRQLTAHLQTVREEERIQIARDIHDELGQQLTGLKMEMNSLNKKLKTEDEIVKQKMNSIIELLDETLTSLRRISSNLRPSLLDDFGLIAALEWHSEEVAKRSEIKVNFSADMHESDIPVTMATGIFRIYQELLTNAVRHSNAHVITSCLRLKDKHLILKVKDDGQGMDPEVAGTKKTLGLIGIKERTFALGGRYDLTSEPGKGTEVQISIPL